MSSSGPPQPGAAPLQNEVAPATRAPLVTDKVPMVGPEAESEVRIDYATEAALVAPVDENDVEIREDGIIYLPWVWFQRRLMAAFGPLGFKIVPRAGYATRNNLVVYHGALMVRPRGTGGTFHFVSEAIGECQYVANNRAMTYGGAAEGARSDCLSRCCKQLGMGSELWDKRWREAWAMKHAESFQKAGRSRWRRKGATEEPRYIPDPDYLDASFEDVTNDPADGSAPPPVELATLTAELASLAPPHRLSWLRRYFQVDEPRKLSPAQIAVALRLVAARKLGQDAYNRAVETELDAGTIKVGG